MPQTPRWRVTDHRPARQFVGRKLSRRIARRAFGHLAQIDDPFANLRERDAHQPTAAFAGAPRQRHHGAERHQIAGAIIDGRYGVELRSWRLGGHDLCLARRYAAHGLHHRIEPAA